MANKISLIKERVIEILETIGIPKEKFYKEIGMTSASFRGKAKESPLNSNAIENILSLLPDINTEWLLTGEGSMLKSDAEPSLSVQHEDLSECEGLRQQLQDEQERLKEAHEEIGGLKYQLKELKVESEKLKVLLREAHEEIDRLKNDGRDVVVDELKG